MREKNIKQEETVRERRQEEAGGDRRRQVETGGERMRCLKIKKGHIKRNL